MFTRTIDPTGLAARVTALSKSPHGTVAFAPTGPGLDCQDDDAQEVQYEEDSDDGGGFGYGEDNDNEGGVNDDLVGAAFGAKERTKHGDYSAFEHPLERRANELKQNDCKVWYSSLLFFFHLRSLGNEARYLLGSRPHMDYSDPTPKDELILLHERQRGSVDGLLLYK